MNSKLIWITVSSCFFIYNFSFGQMTNIMDQANAASLSGNHNDAIQLYSKVIESKDAEHIYSAYYGRAYCYFDQKNYELSIKDIKKSLKVKKSNKNYNTIKGNSYWLYALSVKPNEPTSKSVKLLKKSSKYAPTSLLFSTIGFDEIYLGKYENALKSLNKSILIDVNNAWAFSNRALAYLKLNKLGLARKDVDKSIRMDDSNPFAYKHSALIYIAVKDLDSACSELEKAVILETSSRMADRKLDEIVKLQNEYCPERKK